MEIFNSPFVLIAAGLITVLLGIGAGMLISSLSEESEPEEESADQAPPGGRKGRYQPVARLWREKGSGALIVETEGKAYVAPEAMSVKERSSVESAARDLRFWLGMGLAAPVDAPQASRPAHPEGPARGVEAAPAVTPRENTVNHYATPVAPIPPPAVRADPYIATSVEGVEEAAVPGLAQKSIVMQIEDILQDMLSGTEMAHKGIHLIEDPVKGVIVRIGLSHYEGIEAVPDPEIKAVIRAAVVEWEKTQ